MGQQLDIPFECRINPHLNQVIEDNIAWMTRHDLIDPKTSLARYRDSDFARLYAYAFPDAAYDDMLLLADFEMFMFLYDDQFAGQRGAALEGPLDAMSHFVAIMQGDRSGPIDTGRLGHAFVDVLARLLDGMSHIWRQHLYWDLQRFFSSYMHEAENRARNSEVIGFDLYLKQRQWALGVDPSLDAIERVGHFELPQHMRSDPYMLGMREDVNYFVALTNDVDSVHKEELAGDTNNSVLIFQKKTGATRQLAIQRMYEMAQDMVTKFQHRHHALTSSGPYTALTTDGRDAVNRYVKGMENWIIAYYTWTRETGRYRPQNALRETRPWNTVELL